MQPVQAYQPDSPRFRNSLKVRETELEGLNMWLRQIHYYQRFVDRVLNGEFDTLSASDRLFVLSYALREDVFQSIVSSRPPVKRAAEFFSKLVETGFDFNQTDHKGLSILAYCEDSKLYCELMQLGFECIHPEHPGLSFYLCKFKIMEDKYWMKCLHDHLSLITEDDLLKLAGNEVENLLQLVQKDKGIASTFWEIFKNIQMNSPEKAAQFFIPLNRNDIPFMLSCILENQLTSTTIECIFTHHRTLSEIVMGKISDSQLEILRNRGPYSLVLTSLMRTSLSMKIILWYAAIFKAQNLNEIARLLAKRHSIFGKAIGDSHINKACLQHIQKEENEVKSTVWMHFQGCYVSGEDLEHLVDFGIDPKKFDAQGRNILFSEDLVWAYETFFTKHKDKIDLEKCDNNGHNALEYFVLNFHLFDNFCCSTTAIKNLVKLGLRISHKLPYYEKCIELFPHDPYEQALLAYLLNCRNLEKAIENISQRSDKDILTAARTIESFRQRIEILRTSFLSYEASESWKINYPPEKTDLLAQEIREWLLHTLSRYWNTPVPLNAFDLVPESCRVSLFCAVLEKRSLTPQIFSLLIPNIINSPNNLFYFFRYLRNHPKTFGSIINQHLKCSSIEIHRKGYFLTNYCSWMATALTELGKKPYTSPYDSRITQGATQFTPRDYLWIPPKAEVISKGDEVVVTFQNKTNVFIVKQDNCSTPDFREKLLFLMTLKLNGNLYQSKFPENIEAHVYLDGHNSLRGRVSKGPLFVYQFQLNDGPAKDLFTLKEEEFEIAEQKWLSDYGKMVSNNLNLQLLSSSKGDTFWRKHCFLNLLKTSLFQNGYFKSFDIFDSMSSLPGAFEALKNLEVSSAGVSYPKSFVERHNFKDEFYFYDMESLARGIYVNVLIHLKKLRDSTAGIQWNNPEHVAYLSKNIVKGFAYICGTYAGIPPEEFKMFMLECDINLDRMAKQILFWSDLTENGFMSWLRKGKLPEELFDNDMEVIINLDSLKEYISNNTFMIDKEECIGVPTGPLGWLDLDKVTHAMTLFSMVHAKGAPKPKEPEYQNNFYHLDDF